MIAIVDYGMGNIGSVYNMLKKIAQPAIITSDKEKISNASKIILPGVGAFDSGMEQLNKLGLTDLLKKKALEDKIPFLGICLGAQLMLHTSEEGKIPGLGIISGEVVKFNMEGYSSNFRIPNMGWNQVEQMKPSNLVDELPDEPRFYFVHSYHFKLRSSEDELLVSNYGYRFCSAFEHDNIAGVQFHPEKSHKFGMQLLRNFGEKF